MACTLPSLPCMIDGYEYWLMGLSSSTNTSFQFLPSLDTATLSGVRTPFGVPGNVPKLLYISRWRPSFNVTASVPELLLGTEVSSSGDHVSPLSLLQAVATFPLRVRQSTC